MSFIIHKLNNKRKTHTGSKKKGDLSNDVSFYCRTCRDYRVHCRYTENVSCSTQTYPVIPFYVSVPLQCTLQVLQQKLTIFCISPFFLDTLYTTKATKSAQSLLSQISQGLFQLMCQSCGLQTLLYLYFCAPYSCICNVLQSFEMQKLDKVCTQDKVSAGVMYSLPNC